MRIASGRTDAKLAFVAVDATDLKTRKTGLSSFTVYRSRNGGTATVYTTPTVAELSSTNMPGVYVLTIDEDTTVTSGADEEEYVVHITASTMAPVTRAVELFRPKIDEGKTVAVASAGTGRIKVGEWLSDPVPALIGNRLDAIVGAYGTLTGIATGTSDSGSTTDFVDTARTEADTDYWKNSVVVFTGGTLSGMSRVIVAFNPSTDTITFTPATPVAVGTHTYIIVPGGQVEVASILANIISADAVSAAAANKLADHTWRRTLANIAASSFGDTIIERSPINALRKLVNRVRHVPGAPGTLDTYEEDDTTIAMSQAATTDGSVNPIKELDT